MKISPSLLVELLVCAAEGAAEQPNDAELVVPDEVIEFLVTYCKLNPDRQMSAWALNELRRSDER